ncbi:histidine-rich glycoprotein-like [Anoplophora glabripennis]|uniref:histidine-rich glycoprotein-like n=1 Tax=Anoplophora glabripennis TaxID=217634 RepID=UPI0008740614|nr:histidine-rich glycoprotein-like [Anoplophora glabripennis]
MAQFVTHIQPTLVEASHHHLPHSHHHKEHHKDHYLKEHHGKEHHAKDHHHAKEHGSEKHMAIKSPHKMADRPREIHYKDLHMGHSREYPVLPHSPVEQHHHDGEAYHGEQRRDSAHYFDSHGLVHPYDIHFMDSQGIYRDYQGHGIEVDDIHKDYSTEKEKHHKARSVDKSPLDGVKPIPPKFIDIQPVHGENKLVRYLFA